MQTLPARSSRFVWLTFSLVLGAGCDTFSVISALGVPNENVERSCVIQVLSADEAILEIVHPSDGTIAAAHLRIPEHIIAPNTATRINVVYENDSDRLAIRTYSARRKEIEGGKFRGYEAFVQAQVDRITSKILSACGE